MKKILTTGIIGLSFLIASCDKTLPSSKNIEVTKPTPPVSSSSSSRTNPSWTSSRSEPSYDSEKYISPPKEKKPEPPRYDVPEVLQPEITDGVDQSMSIELRY